jgi:glycosyltransferase involved in cell wall biosynthesis
MVVHVVVAGHLGGAEHFLVNLASRANLTGVDHCVALMTPNPKLRDHFVKAGLRLRDRGPAKENLAAYLWRSFGFREIAWLRRVLQEEGASLIHVHTFGSQILAARVARQLDIPLVRTEHGVGVYRDPTRAFLRRWALRRADRIVAVSEFVKQAVEEADPTVRSRVRVVRNGVDTSHFRPDPNRPDGPFMFSMLTRLERVKRVDLAIEALPLVPDAYMEIFGEGSQRPALERLASVRGVRHRVKFCGYCADAPAAISRSDASINCTREEGLGLAVIEAAAMERASVAFAGGGIPEVIEDGRTGWLTGDYSAAGFAAAMRKAADRARAREFGVNARKRAIELFDIDRMCRDYALIYDELTRGVPEPGNASLAKKESLPE